MGQIRQRYYYHKLKYRILIPGYRTPDSTYWSGHKNWILDTGQWILDTHWIQTLNTKHQGLDTRYWILDTRH